MSDEVSGPNQGSPVTGSDPADIEGVTPDDDAQELDVMEGEDNEDQGCSLTEPELQELAEEAQSYITGCAYDEPWDEGETVWIHEHTSVGDVLERVGVPDECREAVAELIDCPSCGDHHGVYEEVAVKSEGELRYESLLEEWYREHADRLDAFYQYLSKFPYLGVAHELGSEIREGLKRFPVRAINDEIWFRARRIKSGKPLVADDFKPPDPLHVVISEGRYNHHGQSAFYLARDKQGAAAECMDDGETRAWVQQYKLVNLQNVLDLSLEENWADEGLPVLAAGLMHSGALQQPVQRSLGWKPQYFIPRFIADCAREAGFAGILFKSTRHLRDNLVLFGFDPANVVPEGEPEITEVKPFDPAEWMFATPPNDDTLADLL